MNYVERCLFDFYHNIALMASLFFQLHNLVSVQAQGYDVHIYNSQNDPVSDVLIRKEKLQDRIDRIQKKVIPVRKLDDALSVSDVRTHQMKDILHKKYWQHKPFDELLREMHISKSTLKRRSRELLNFARSFFHEGQH